MTCGEAWFGPPMARRSLALPMLLFRNRLRFYRNTERCYLEGYRPAALRLGHLLVAGCDASDRTCCFP